MPSNKGNHSPEAQRERWERGTDFQEEFRSSLHRVPKCWFKRLVDGSGPQPFDTLALLDKVSLGLEFKRKKSGTLDFSDLRPNQVTGLLNFNNCLTRNVGAVAVHFLDEDAGLDECYLVSIQQLLDFYLARGTRRAALQDFKDGVLGLLLPRHVSGEGWYLQTAFNRIAAYRKKARYSADNF